jgi:hypothetical protein
MPQRNIGEWRYRSTILHLSTIWKWGQPHTLAASHQGKIPQYINNACKYYICHFFKWPHQFCWPDKKKKTHIMAWLTKFLDIFQKLGTHTFRSILLTIALLGPTNSGKNSTIINRQYHNYYITHMLYHKLILKKVNECIYYIATV